MKTNSQLNVALHTLGHLAAAHGNSMTSEALASCAGTNPVVVRRILGVLRKADLVSSAPGRSGGWTLTRQPKKITLGEIHSALSTTPQAQLPARKCTIANRLVSRLETALQRAEHSMRRELDQTTLADLV